MYLDGPKLDLKKTSHRNKDSVACKWEGQRKNKNGDHLKCVRHAEGQIHCVQYKDSHLSVTALSGLKDLEKHKQFFFQ